MDALAFLEKAGNSTPQPVYVLCGDEDFLKREARAVLEPLLLGDADPSFALATYPGDTARFSAVRAELDTLPFLSPCRVVVIEQADEFVTNFRPQLEKYLTAPSKGVLILEVRTWPPNTKLAKALPDAGTLVCKSPPAARLPGWCSQHAQSKYGKKLPHAAAAQLVELVGPEMGLLDQEIAKLAAYVGNAPAISEDDVDAMVGRSRAAETFKIFDAIGNGRTGDALAILQRLFDEGSNPIQILGAFSWQLRKLAQAARLVKDGMAISKALTEVGIFKIREAEQQLRHLGMRRLDKLFDWLLELDLGLKGSNPLPEKTQLERLIVRLGQPREAVKA